ncbi:MAG: RNA polymerase sigma-70 factor [Spirosomataceae bacterium]
MKNTFPELDNYSLEDSDLLISLNRSDSESIIHTKFRESELAGMEQLYKMYYAVLCSHAVRFVTSKEIAEDIVSDIFYEFQTKQLHLSITISFRAYLFASVRNRSFDHVRTEIRHKKTSLDGAYMVASETENNPDSIMQYEELRHDVEFAINGMPIKRRQVYIMHRFEGKKYQDIAEDLQLSIRTVEAHLYQATKHIKEIIQKKWTIF